jgi:hypothetical protein
VQVGGLTAGETYTLQAAKKGYTFQPVSISATSGLTQFDIVANP